MRLLTFLFLSLSVLAAEQVTVDFTAAQGAFKPLNGVNKGPSVGGGIIDLTKSFQSNRIPFVRLHDCRWPHPDVVDMHVLFPRPEADPRQESSYYFATTDDYLQAIRASGAQIIYRLGQSIEHTRIKRFVHPPADPKAWAQICLGIIRHYNEGWANGFKFGIPYWEIWNEPENRPVMWTGSDADYFELYRQAATAIKRSFPHLKVGGPAVGNSGSLKNGHFEPSKFLREFVELCRAEKLPLDFLSWHCYTDNPGELVLRARGVRRLLDENGFKRTESHLNEWNYLPENNWGPIMKEATPEQRQAWYARMGGPEGAAFVSAAFCLLEDAPLDLAAFFHGEIGGFGLFNEHGVVNDVHNAFALYALATSGSRVPMRNNDSIPALASLDGQTGKILLVNPARDNRAVDLVLNFGNEAKRRITIQTIPAGKRPDPSLTGNQLKVELAPWSVTFIQIQPE